MGCDGGSIPKRHEVVKSKTSQADDKNNDISSRWNFCALSGLRLKQPIVACQLGHLFNKDSIIEYILDSRISTSSTSVERSCSYHIVRHIKSLKDVTELKLTTVSSKSDQGTESSSSQKFACPITNLEMNGKYKFCYLKTCGCVVSDRALKQIPGQHQCLLCSAPFNPNEDIYVINPTEEELKQLKERMQSIIKLAKQKHRKKQRIGESSK